MNLWIISEYDLRRKFYKELICSVSILQSLVLSSAMRSIGLTLYSPIVVWLSETWTLTLVFRILRLPDLLLL
jgi:hypothetical protein